MIFTTKYLGPAWKRVPAPPVLIEESSESWIVPGKLQQVRDEYFDMDDSVYLPLQDFLYMLETPDDSYTPKKFEQWAYECPDEYIDYVLDTRPLEP